MTVALVLDTETTGMFDFKKASDAEGQPRMIQLAALLVNDAKQMMSCFSLLIKPDGWTVPAEATAINGITTEDCVRYGVPVCQALEMFRALFERADLTVAHNHSFDQKVIRGEAKRMQSGPPFIAVLREWRDQIKPQFCTMQMATAACKLPKTSTRGAGGFKWPKLEEAYEILCGKKMTGAHDAWTDARACAAVYFKLKDGA